MPGFPERVAGGRWRVGDILPPSFLSSFPNPQLNMLDSEPHKTPNERSPASMPKSAAPWLPRFSDALGVREVPYGELGMAPLALSAGPSAASACINQRFPGTPTGSTASTYARTT